jgi:hypothetical protein
MSTPSPQTLMYHGLYEMCETELEGGERYGHLGFGYEKFRQHQKYHSLSANPEKDKITFEDMSTNFLYLRQYLHQLNLHDSFDSTPFSEVALKAATMTVEMTDKTPTVNGCLNPFGDLVKEWTGGRIKEMAQKGETRMFQIISSWPTPPQRLPANTIVTPDCESHEPSIGCEWLKPPGGERDAFFEHHARMVEHYDDELVQYFTDCMLSNIPQGQDTYS